MKVLTERDRETIKARFLDRMTAIYSVPFHLKESGRMTTALGEYMDALNRFSASELDAGWQKLRNTYNGKSWPTVRECLDACQTAPAGRRKAQEGERMTVDQAMRSPLGAEAVRDGWAAGLAAFVQDAGVLPEGKALHRLRHPTQSAQQTLDSITDQMPAAALLRSIGREMIRREQEYQKRYGEQEVVF